MSADKKLWQLPTPFRRGSGKQDLLPKPKGGHSGSRVSSVYLSDDSSTSGFVIVPEFDDPPQTDTSHQESNHTSRLCVVTSPEPLSPDGVDDYLYDLQPIGSQSNSYLGGGPCDTSVVQDDDLTQRLSSAYEQIRSMPSAASPEALSSDPQMLRKQLGVPQHSVLNYPIHSSLDLPNPHTSPREPTPPILLSEKFGLRVNTGVYPPSPRHCSPDPFQPAQRKSTVTAPTLPENSFSERSTLGEPWSAHVACASKPQPIPSSSKLAKRRVEKPIVSSFSLPPSRRHALRGVSRKPAADTPPSNNAPRWQTSLPQIRSPSPFRVDIPLHHSWHDRRTDFNSHECHSKRAHFHENKSRLTSGSTDVLASLAWIGASPMVSSPYTVNREHHPASPAFLPDRLSMVIAVEDDSISDDVLVDRLEKVRRTSDPSERSRDIPPSRFSGKPYFRSVGEGENGFFHPSCPSPSQPTPGKPVKSCDASLPSPLMSKDTTSDSDDAAVWQAARKALLCIREIVRTEKKYQEALKMLLNAQTATPPPPSMAPYVSALVRASEMLLKCFLEDPSAWGVSTAFVTSEDELEATMVSWCAVAGGFFTDENDPQRSGLTGKRRLRKSGMTSSSSSPSVTKQTSNSFTPQLPPMFSMTSTASKTKERMDEEYRTGKYPLTEQEKKTTSVSLQNPESTKSQTLSGQPPSRKLSVRDLAIQPTQRVMRYVLLYRDLLDCTPPTSPSRLLVERALEAAMRIANHCDRAQRNPAFCRVY